MNREKHWKTMFIDASKARARREAEVSSRKLLVCSHKSEGEVLPPRVAVMSRIFSTLFTTLFSTHPHLFSTLLNWSKPSRLFSPLPTSSYFFSPLLNSFQLFSIPFVSDKLFSTLLTSSWLFSPLPNLPTASFSILLTFSHLSALLERSPPFLNSLPSSHLFSSSEVLSERSSSLFSTRSQAFASQPELFGTFSSHLPNSFLNLLPMFSHPMFSQLSDSLVRSQNTPCQWIPSALLAVFFIRAERSVSSAVQAGKACASLTLDCEGWRMTCLDFKQYSCMPLLSQLQGCVRKRSRAPFCSQGPLTSKLAPPHSRNHVSGNDVEEQHQGTLMQPFHCDLQTLTSKTS